MIDPKDKLQCLLCIYENDREEQRLQENRLSTIFLTFVILIIGATNAFLSLKLSEIEVYQYLAFILSLISLCLCYFVIHNRIDSNLKFIIKAKIGREILIKIMLNEAFVDDFRSYFNSESKMNEFKKNIDSPHFPFFDFDKFIHYEWSPFWRYYKIIISAISILAISVSSFICLIKLNM